MVSYILPCFWTNSKCVLCVYICMRVCVEVSCLYGGHLCEAVVASFYKESEHLQLWAVRNGCVTAGIEWHGLATFRAQFQGSRLLLAAPAAEVSQIVGTTDVPTLLAWLENQTANTLTSSLSETSSVCACIVQPGEGVYIPEGMLFVDKCLHSNAGGLRICCLKMHDVASYKILANACAPTTVQQVVSICLTNVGDEPISARDVADRPDLAADDSDAEAVNGAADAAVVPSILDPAAAVEKEVAPTLIAEVKDWRRYYTSTSSRTTLRLLLQLLTTTYYLLCSTYYLLLTTYYYYYYYYYHHYYYYYYYYYYY
jgi:hypothetical protein